MLGGLVFIMLSALSPLLAVRSTLDCSNFVSIIPP